MSQSHHDLREEEFSFKKLFVPLTTFKAIHWIIIIGFIVYGNTFFNGFVIDDLSQLPQQSSVQVFSNIFSFFRGSTFYNGGDQLIGIYYRPLTSIYFAFMYSLFGLNFVPYHILQIIMHIINSLILFFIFNRFFKKSVGFFLSLIFLAHPINSENVFYISSMQEVLSFLFGILALWILISFHAKKTLFVVSFLLLLSLFSKESGMLFIFIALVYVFIFNKKTIFSLLTNTIAIIAIYLFLRLISFGGFLNPQNTPINKLSFFERLLNMPEMFYFYIKTFVFPVNLSSSYQWVYSSITTTHFFMPLVIDIVFIATISYFGIMLYKKKYYSSFKLYLFFTIWFALGIIIHLHIVPLDSTVAERWFYFPIVGALGMLGVLFDKFNFYLNNKWTITTVLIMLILLSAKTYMRSFDWRDDFTLATRDIKVSNNAYDLENRIAAGFLAKGDLQEAKMHAERSTRLYPYVTNYSTLGTVYLKLGDHNKAREAFLSALKFGEYYPVYGNLCILALVDGDGSKEMKYITYALKKFSSSHKLWTCYAILEYKRKNNEVAKNAIIKAYYYSQNPETTEFYNIIMNNKPLNLNITAGQE